LGNDINFSGCVGDVIIEGTVERGLARRGGFVTFVPESQNSSLMHIVG